MPGVVCDEVSDWRSSEECSLGGPMEFHPYLVFGGNCAEAFRRYHEIFGGDVEIMMMSDVPADVEMDAGPDDMVMHASLTVGDGMLFGSDDPTGEHQGARDMAVSITVDTVDEVHRVFDALAEGGSVTMPVDAVFWGPAFGMCTDKFGTPWMVGADH